MRDLANQNYKAGSRNRRVIKIGVFVILVLGIYLFLKNSGANIGLSSSSIVLKEAPKGLTPVTLPPDVADIGKGISLTTQNAVFVNVSGEVAKATATRKFGDGSYTLTVEATLPDPKNNRYQVWIIGDTPTDAGFMIGSGSTWTSTFRDKDYYSKYSQIWITREITDNEGKPEKRILEGSF